ncbi:hypothetical protein BKA61DRAFT_600683 [Leptodontidium sp. MPI-SDFR-AT-0119]|nr:hypothetical protein BKA61DRAFT_600683 [Leptodontidium sp. MPI-SDFR-AT-0119]
MCRQTVVYLGSLAGGPLLSLALLPTTTTTTAFSRAWDILCKRATEGRAGEGVATDQARGGKCSTASQSPVSPGQASPTHPNPTYLALHCQSCTCRKQDAEEPQHQPQNWPI